MTDSRMGTLGPARAPASWFEPAVVCAVTGSFGMFHVVGAAGAWVSGAAACALAMAGAALVLGRRRSADALPWATLAPLPLLCGWPLLVYCALWVRAGAPARAGDANWPLALALVATCYGACFVSRSAAARIVMASTRLALRERWVLVGAGVVLAGGLLGQLSRARAVPLMWCALAVAGLAVAIRRARRAGKAARVTGAVCLPSEHGSLRSCASADVQLLDDAIMPYRHHPEPTAALVPARRAEPEAELVRRGSSAAATLVVLATTYAPLVGGLAYQAAPAARALLAHVEGRVDAAESVQDAGGGGRAGDHVQ